MTTKEFAKILQDKLTSEYGVELSVASQQQIYRALALISPPEGGGDPQNSRPVPLAPAPSKCITSAWSF